MHHNHYHHAGLIAFTAHRPFPIDTVAVLNPVRGCVFPSKKRWFRKIRPIKPAGLNREQLVSHRQTFKVFLKSMHVTVLIVTDSSMHVKLSITQVGKKIPFLLTASSHSDPAHLDARDNVEKKKIRRYFQF